MTISASMATKAMAPHRHPNATATAPLTETVDNSDKAPVVRNILAERYKTQMCRHYEAKGGMAATFKCPYESKCMFAHGPDDLRTLEMNLRDGILSEESIEAFRRAQRCLRKRANKAARKALAAAAASSDSANNDKSNVADATTSLDASVYSPCAIAKVFDCESQRYGRPSFLSPVTTASENVFSPTTGAHNPTTHLLLGDTVHVLNESYNDDAGASYTNTPKMFGVSVSSTRSDSGKISPMVPAPLVTNDVVPFDSNQPYVYANYCHNGGIGGRICVDPTTTMAGLVEEESLGTYGPSSYGSTMATSISSWGFSRTQSVQLRPNHRVLPAPRHHDMNAPQQRYRHDPYRPLGCQLSQ